VTQTMLQTNPASSRAIAVTTTALGNEYVNMLEDMVSLQ
jgi:hypothetical protein